MKIVKSVSVNWRKKRIGPQVKIVEKISVLIFVYFPFFSHCHAFSIMLFPLCMVD